MIDYAWIVVAFIGGFIVADGIASILVQGRQHHGFWFDFERELRALGGLVLVALAIWRIVG